MRISDWSSDVCSSDLARTLALRAGAAVHHRGDGAAPGDRRRIRWRAEVQARQAGRHVRALARREGKRRTGPATMPQLENTTVDLYRFQRLHAMSLAIPSGRNPGGIGPDRPTGVWGNGGYGRVR